MAGLLSDVLPWVYSRGNALQRHVSGLLSDPIGSIQQTAGLLQDEHRTQEGLNALAFSNQKRPFQVTDQNALAQMVDRTMAGPLGMAPAGITAWHGSPHIFDKFDSSKIGTGEGAQAYGHGLYLAERPGVANYYKEALSTSPAIKNRQATWEQMKFVKPDGTSLAGVDLFREMYKPGNKLAGRTVTAVKETEAGPVAVLADRYGKQADYPYSATRVMDPMAVSASVPKDWVRDMGGGSLYKVDLPDPVVAKMLDWDRKLSEQAPEVQKALDSVVSQSIKPYQAVDGTTMYMATVGGQQKPFATESEARAHLYNTMDGASAYLLGGKSRQASESLAGRGIPGIRYLDGGSRRAGQGSSNFVIFPQEEGVLKILERNGQPIK